MSKIQDDVKKAQGLLNPDGSRKYSDQEIYQKVLATDSGKKGLEAAGERGLQDYLGLTLSAPQDPNPVTRYGKMIGGALVQGAGAMVGMPGSAIHLASNLLSPYGWGQSEDSPLMKIPTGGDINAFTENLGLSDRADASPQNLPERLLEGASEGVGASIPLALVGGPEAAPAMITSGIGSGLGEQGMNELFPNSPLAGLFGSVLGGFAGQGLARSLGEGLVKSNLSKKLDDLTKSWTDMTANEAIAQQTMKAAKDKVIAAADEAFKKDLSGTDAATIAAQAGPLAVIEGHAARLNPMATGWQDAGENLKASVGKWYNETLPQQLDAVWEPLNKAIPNDAPVKLDNFGRILTSIDKKAGVAQGLVDQLVPNLPSRLKKTFDEIVNGQITAGLPGFTWKDIKTLRTALGDAMRDPKILPNIGDTNLKALYAGLTEDLRGTAKAAGAEDLFNAANTESSRLFSIAEGPVAKILDTAKSPGELAKGLVTKGRVDATDLATLRGIAPDGVDALAAVGLTADERGVRAYGYMTPTAKMAMIPSQQVRDELDAALAALDGTKSASGVARSAAQQARDETRRAATEGHQNWVNMRRQDKAALKAELEKTRAEHQKLTSGASSVALSLDKLKKMATGGVVGGALGTALEALGLNPEALINSHLGALLALGVPAGMHMTAELLKHPDLAAGPLIGLTTHNALQREKQ